MHSKLLVVFLNCRLIFLRQGGNIIAMFTFHISHVISKSGRFSKKGIAHAISSIIRRAEYGTWKKSDRRRESHYYKRNSIIQDK